jgi:hypothetical protein
MNNKSSVQAQNGYQEFNSHFCQNHPYEYVNQNHKAI